MAKRQLELSESIPELIEDIWNLIWKNVKLLKLNIQFTQYLKYSTTDVLYHKALKYWTFINPRHLKAIHNSRALYLMSLPSKHLGTAKWAKSCWFSAMRRGTLCFTKELFTDMAETNYRVNLTINPSLCESFEGYPRGSYQKFIVNL